MLASEVLDFNAVAIYLVYGQVKFTRHHRLYNKSHTIAYVVSVPTPVQIKPPFRFV